MALKDSYLSLITSQHKDKPKFAATMSKLLQYSEDVFATAIYFDDEFDLDLAAGKQQNILGDVIGLDRRMDFSLGPEHSSILNDDEYRVLQKAKIIRNLWNGKIEDLYEKWMVLFGTPIRIKDNQDMTLDVLLDIDESEAMQALMKLVSKGLIIPKPMAVRINYQLKYPEIFHKWEIRHRAECDQIVDARHKVWNFGHVRTIRFDSEFDFDRAIRWDAIYGDYRERQQHRVEIWCTVEAWQRNLVPVNVLDGDFEFLGNHTWSGMAMIRVPKHKSTSCGIVEVQQKSIEVRNSVAVMNSPEVYLENPISYTSANLQFSDSHQEIKSRQISETIESVVTSHEQKSSHVAAVKQTPVSSQKINIKNRVVSTNKVVATQNTDYRTASLADGSFCMDGTHVFEGAVQQNYAKAAHCCSIARITKNGIGRIERT